MGFSEVRTPYVDFTWPLPRANLIRSRLASREQSRHLPNIIYSTSNGGISPTGRVGKPSPSFHHSTGGNFQSCVSQCLRAGNVIRLTLIKDHIYKSCYSEKTVDVISLASKTLKTDLGIHFGSLLAFRYCLKMLILPFYEWMLEWLSFLFSLLLFLDMNGTFFMWYPFFSSIIPTPSQTTVSVTMKKTDQLFIWSVPCGMMSFLVASMCSCVPFLWVIVLQFLLCFRTDGHHRYSRSLLKKPLLG